jgi:hypothetical protein
LAAAASYALLRFAMLLISPCAVVVCGPRWALPQAAFRLVYQFRNSAFHCLGGAGWPAVLSGVVIGCPNPALQRWGINPRR